MTTLHCACGRVAMEAVGAPIVSAACYCDDCQAGGAEIEALPGARPFRDADGGIYMALYRKDRFRVTEGAELLVARKLRPKSPTNRVVAGCCNSALFVNFDGGPHWVSVYRSGFDGAAPPLEMRLSTKFAPDVEAIPRDVPVYRSFSAGFVLRLIGARIGMMFG